MKNFNYTLFIGLFVFINNITAQEDRTSFNDEDSFTYKTLEVTDRESGTINFPENSKILDSNTEPQTQSQNKSTDVTNTSLDRIQGTLSVSLTGGANYDVPIDVPQGIDGIVPEISINYNSQNGNGLIAYGWNLKGISVISRIPSSKFHDGQIDGIDFDELDRFSLDGQRLMLKSGTYGSDGAQYETEKYTNLKITSHGVAPISASDGPNYFMVYYPDGSKAKYGHASNSRLNYSITYWENPQGVRISYYYNLDNGQSISSIRYGSLNADASINEVRFNYSELNRWDQNYVTTGNVLIRSKRLTDIETYSNGTRNRIYTLQTINDTPLNYVRLTDIYERKEEYDSSSRIGFHYTNTGSSVNYTGLTTIGVNNIEQRNAEVMPLDMTGNGKMDFIVYPKNDKTKFWMFYDLQDTNNFPIEVTTGNFESIFPSNLLNWDNKVLSGQGLTVVQNGTGRQVNLKVFSKAGPSTGVPIGHDYTKIWNSPGYSNQNCGTCPITQKKISKEYVSGDFNGDGLTDVLAIGKPYTRQYCYIVECDDGGIGIDDEESPWIPYPLPSMNKTIPEILQQENESNVNFKLRIKKHKEKLIQNKLGRGPIVPGGGNNVCYECSTYSVNNKRVHLINLRRDMPSNFVTNVGNLQLQLSGDYKLQTGDFNGDGKTDLLHITNGKLYIYSLDNNNNLSLLWQLTDSGINTIDPLILGDFNGDGKTDFLDPIANNSYSFRTFISTGNSFIYETRTQPFRYRRTNWNGNDGVLTGYNLVPVDINGDGKTDIIDYKTLTYNGSTNGSQTIKIYKNMGVGGPYPTRINFEIGGTATKIGNLKHFPIPIFLNSNQPNKNLEFASISDRWVTNFSFTQDHREDVLLRSVWSNDIIYDIEYGNLDPDIYNSDSMQVYQSHNDERYPNIDLTIALGVKVVTMLSRRGGNVHSFIPIIKKVYSYKGAVYNAEGLGFLGFKGIAESNWHTGNSDRTFTISKYDSDLRGALIENYTMLNYFNFNTPSNYISRNVFQYSSGLSTNKVFKLSLNSSFNENNLEGTNTNVTYQYDLYNNATNKVTSFAGGSNIQTITYSNNTGSNYYIGRPTNTTTSSTVDGETFSTEQQFIYSGHLLVQKKMKSNASTFDIETYNYDSFGNIIKKIRIPNGETPREINFEYDPSGRFLTKSIDVEGLEISYEYNTLLGLLTKETSPFGQETNYEYDGFNNIKKMIDFLGNESSSIYNKESTSTNIIALNVNTVADDGSENILIYDDLIRLTQRKKKNVLGDWVNITYEYDALDRLIRESQPYMEGNAPSQWNETTYDIYNRPITQTLYTGRVINISYSNLTTTVDDGVKTVSSTRNQLGNTVSVTDPGGTINYTYYGNGGLKETNYNGVIVSTEQDDWGRKTKLIDPSAGTYEYSYNGFGEVINTTTPKGATSYVYSPLGKLLEKNISGDNNYMTIQYTYNSIHKFLNSISFVNSDGNNSNYSYSYDSYSRLTGIAEVNPYAEFTKQYTYDSYGRIDTEQNYGKLLSNNRSSTKKIKNIYQNGVLKTIKDFNTNKNIANITGVNARGKLTSSLIGNNILGNKSYDSYGYLTNVNIIKDAESEMLMQLTTDFDVQKGTLNGRTNSVFSWGESFEYDNLDRLITFNDNDGNNSITYDNLGRIDTNNTVGEYNYAGSTSYQLTNIDLNNQGDLYYQQNRLEQIKYNAFKKPVEINEEGKEKISFQYNAFKMRSHMFYGGTEDDINQRNNSKHYSFDGQMEISHDKDSDETIFVTYIGGDAYSAPAIWRSKITGSDTQRESGAYYYLHRDYLGSILLITDGNGNAKEKRHFDAWGKIVKLTDGNDVALDKMMFLDRGYTGHEHLQGVNLIHMNGRLYDSNLKRFLSPDNNITDITNTQNYNRYAYVLNNPLRYVDPSGETHEGPPHDEGGFTNAEQSLIGGLIASAFQSLEGADFSGFRNFVGRNFQSAIKDIVRPVREIGRFFNRLFGGSSNEKAAPVEYSNYEGLSSDPLAGSSNGNTLSNFGAGGTGTGGLGISEGNNGNSTNASGVSSDSWTRYIPVYGSAIDAYDSFARGDYWTGAFHTVMAISDVFLVKSLVVGIGKFAVRQGTKAYAKSVAKTYAQQSIKGVSATAVEGIYQFTAASGKTYVGQSKNIALRLKQHISSGKLLPGTSVRTTEILGGKLNREIAEQLRINSLNGIDYLENLRNPIGKARQYLLQNIP